VIADRSLDLSTMLHHTWTYQALIADVLDMQLNRIRMEVTKGQVGSFLSFDPLY